MKFRRDLYGFLVAMLLGLCSSLVSAQEFDVLTFDSESTGIWSDVEATTLVVPQIADGSFTLDGSPSSAEYGGFEGVTVTPGDNAWLLNWPPDRQWDNAEDSSFTFYLAHDTNYFYVGVDVLDDFVISDDANGAFWRDDAIEIVTDVWNDNYDNNTDNSEDAYGGHLYANYEGRFSAWNEDTASIEGTRFSSAIDDWQWGPDDSEENDVAGFGEATETGWNMELRFEKRLFEDPDSGIKLEEGTRMGFNIGLDDDDGFGTGPDGDGSRTQDLELQYFWANRERFFGWNAEADDGFFWEPEMIEESFERLANGTLDPNDPDLLSFDYQWGVNGGGRLAHGGAGEIIFGGMSDVEACNPNTGGDMDQNGMVEFADFLILSTNFGQDVSSHAEGDIDCNGKVEFADFLVLSTNFGGTGQATAVPEPASCHLAILVVAGLAISRRRRR